MQHRITLRIVERIEHLLTGVDSIQRRHRHEHVTIRYEWAEVP